MFTVGQMAHICGVSAKTLRHYEAIGLFRPAWVDPVNQCRYYSAEQILPLRRILFLRDLGLGLEVARALVQSGALNDPSYLTGILQERAEELRREIAQREGLLQRIDGVVQDLARMEDGEPVTSRPVVVKELPAMQVTGLRRTVSPAAIGPLLGEVRQRLNARPTGPAICLFHNPEFDPDLVDVEALFPVAEGGTQWLPTMRVAALIHEQPGHDVGASYEALWRWIEQHGYTAVGLPREVYLTEPGTAKLVIEIQYPIEQQGESQG